MENKPLRERKSKYPKMATSQRAKQFMPFAALKGYEESLSDSRWSPLEKPDLSQDELETLERRFKTLNPGDSVELTYYQSGYSLRLQGSIVKVDEAFRRLFLVPLDEGEDVPPGLQEKIEVNLDDICHICKNE